MWVIIRSCLLLSWSLGHGLWRSSASWPASTSSGSSRRWSRLEVFVILLKTFLKQCSEVLFVFERLKWDNLFKCKLNWILTSIVVLNSDSSLKINIPNSNFFRNYSILFYKFTKWLQVAVELGNGTWIKIWMFHADELFVLTLFYSLTLYLLLSHGADMILLIISSFLHCLLRLSKLPRLKKAMVPLDIITSIVSYTL